jgi:hypothetical protein
MIDQHAYDHHDHSPSVICSANTCPEVALCHESVSVLPTFVLSFNTHRQPLTYIVRQVSLAKYHCQGTYLFVLLLQLISCANRQ